MLGDHKVVFYLDQWMVPRMMVFPEISMECLDFLIFKFIDNNLKMWVMVFMKIYMTMMFTSLGCFSSDYKRRSWNIASVCCDSEHFEIR